MFLLLLQPCSMLQTYMEALEPQKERMLKVYKNLTMKYFKLLILLFWAGSNVQAQKTQISTAKLNLEYRRMICKDSAELVRLSEEIAIWYLNQQHFDEALKEMKWASNELEKHSDASFAYHHAVCAFFSDSFELSLRLLEGIKLQSDSITLQTKILEVFCLNYLGQFEEAQSKFTAISNQLELNPSAMDSLYQQAKSLKLKSPRKARIMSAFLPGLGQLYSGRTGKGATSFMLVSLCAGYAAFNIVTGYYVTSVLTGASMFLRFYQGGKLASYNYALRYNEDSINLFASDLCKLEMNHLESVSVNLHLLKP